VTKPREQWSAVHQALLNELRWRMAGHDLLITETTVEDLVDHLADVVVANFELTARPARAGWFRRRRNS